MHTVSPFLTAATVLAAALALSACEVFDRARTEQVSESGPTVSYRLNGQDLAAVERRADDYCNRYNMEPRLIQTTRQAGGETVAVFECRR